MVRPGTGSRLDRQLAIQWSMLVLVLASVAAYLAVTLFFSYRAVAESEQANLRTQAHVLNENLSERLESTRAALDRLRSVLLPIPKLERDRAAVTLEMQQMVGMLPGIRTIAVVDTTGHVVLSSRRELIGLDVRDREGYILALANPETQRLFLSPPFVTSIGALGMTLARPLTGAKGEFAGVVWAMLDRTYFSTLLASVRYAPDMRASIFHGSGVLFAREPESEFIGTKFPPNSFVGDHLRSGRVETLVQGTTHEGSELRMALLQTQEHSRSLLNVPLVVTVSRNLTEIYAPWRRNASGQGLAFGLFSILAIVAVAAFRRVQRRDARNQERAEERLRLAQSSAGVGVFEANLASDKVTWTQELETMFGLKPGTFGGRARDWYALMHPDDADGVKAYVRTFPKDPDTPFYFEFRTRPASGVVRWMVCRGRIHVDDDGKPLRALGVVVDITERRRMEDELRQNRERFATVFQSSPIGITLSRVSDGLILEHNDVVLNMYGFRRDEVVGHTVYELGLYLNPEDRAVAVNRMRRDGRLEGFEFDFQRRTGERGTIRMSGRIITIAGEELFLASLMDITAQKRNEQALRESQERFASLFDHAPVGISVTTFGTGRYLEVNEAAARMYGYTREEMLGKTTLDLNLYVDPTQRAAAIEELARTGVLEGFEMGFRRKDGSIGTAIVGGRNVQVGGEHVLIVSLLDITDRKVAERKLRESQVVLSTVFNASPVGLTLNRLSDGKIMEFNDAALRMYGYDREEVIGHTISDLNLYANPEHRAVVLERLHRAGFLDREEFDYRRRDGSIGTLWMSGRIVEIDEEKFLLVSVIDITERRLADLALQAAHAQLERRVAERTEQLRNLAVEATLAEERERQAIARDLHDDLGQVLHVARIKLDALAARRRAQDAETIGDVTDLVAQASRMVRSLTSQLSPPVLKDLGLVPALYWLAEEMDRLYGLDTEINDDSLPKPLSPAQSAIMFRAVRELLINVVRHAGVGSAEVRLRSFGHQLTVEVIDEGNGIADLQAALSAHLGFGLASVRERLSFLGGAMEVQTFHNRGTTVTLRMPLEAQRPHREVA